MFFVVTIHICCKSTQNMSNILFSGVMQIEAQSWNI